jgi:hypothetical protein
MPEINPQDQRFYTEEDGERLRGKIVQCDEKGCNGTPCVHYHDHPHKYMDEECFCECCHADHHGFCVERDAMEGVRGE